MATITSPEPSTSPTARVGKNAKYFFADLLELAELQVSLLRIDLNQARMQAIPGIVILCGAIALCVGALPVVLAGLAYALSIATGTPVVWWLIGVGFTVVTCSIIAMMMAMKKLNSSVLAFNNSQSELKQTILWIKEMMLSE